MPIELYDPSDSSKKSFKVLSPKDGKNLQSQLNTNKLTIQQVQAGQQAVLEGVASQSAHEKKEATSVVINDNAFTDILEYDFRNIDGTNQITNWQDLTAAIAYKFVTDGQKQFTAKFEIEYNNERSFIDQKVTDNGSLSFITDEYQLVHPNNVWDAMNSDEKLQSRLDGKLPYNIKIILSAQLGDLTTSNNSSGFVPVPLWTGDTKIILDASFATNTFTLSQNVNVGDYIKVTVASKYSGNEVVRDYVMQTTAQNSNTWGPNILDYNGNPVSTMYNIFGNEFKVYAENTTSHELWIQNIETAEAPSSSYKKKKTKSTKYDVWTISNVTLNTFHIGGSAANVIPLIEDGDAAVQESVDKQVTKIDNDGITEVLDKLQIKVTTSEGYNNMPSHPPGIYFISDTNEIRYGDDVTKKS